MRPLRLELKGFTAFRDPQTIAFEGLDLFAISGPTGSGKTSILDAITYALFGYIDRVGKQAGQFVSQGQTRLAVQLDFAVDDERYRVARSTPSKGATKILLERWDGAEWRQAGEGADRVREADAMIRAAVGLDYEAFTRTALLPQGRFAEFLVGDARQRRDILTDLLGLELFERLGRRAGEMKRQAEAEVGAKVALLETEYAGITPDAVAAAEASAKEAAERDEALAAAEARVREVAARWAEEERAVRELLTCAREAREQASVAARAAEALEDLAVRSGEADALVKDRTKAVAAGRKLAERADAARGKAETEWGGATDLVRLRAKADRLMEARAAHVEAESELAASRAERPKLEKAATATAARLEKAVAGAEAAMGSLEAATSALEDARHADLVAAVRVGMRAGQTCPVCGAVVTALPKTAGASSLAKAEAAFEKARAAAAAASEALDAARRAADAATAELDAADRDLARGEREIAKSSDVISTLEDELAGGLGGPVPPDPVEAIDGRLERLEALEAEAREAAVAATEAKEALVEAERLRDGLAAELAGERGRIEALAVSGLVQRAGELAGGNLPAVPSVGRAKDPAGLAASSAAIADGLGSLADRLEELARERGEGEALAVREAIGSLDDLVDLAGSERLSDVVDAVSAARNRAARDSATAEREAEQIRTKLENATAIVEQVAEDRARAGRFDALSKELRADRLIAFLQVEALQVLAAAGSERLSTLSSGRYRMEFDRDEFFVVDTWNGEERRSARTLSGGETFLASLALALALSEQVRSLSVTDKARLDSLFLDEGFGTLDPETLEVVVDAIEQLGGDGRMVGLITHVQELAIRLPARIEIEKSPRGSSLRVVV